MAADATKKILVVDDDPIVCKLASGILKQNGFEVSTVNDGLDAMNQVKKNAPDLLVLDVMMPEVNGYDVCNNLKFDDQYKHIPIILLTTRDQELDPRVGQMMGIHYMQKPVNSEVLLAKVKSLLK